MTRPQRGSGGLKAGVDEADFPDFPGEEGGSGEEPLGRRSRGSTLTTQDWRVAAKVARDTATGGRGKTPPKIKPDGEH